MTVSYKEKFNILWKEGENFSFYSDVKFNAFVRSSERSTTFSGLLLLNDSMYWVRFNPLAVTQIIDVTNATFYDDVRNEIRIFDISIKIFKTYGVRMIREVDRDLILKLFNVLSSVGIEPQYDLKEKILEFKPQKVIRNDIYAFMSMDNIKHIVPNEYTIVEDEEKFSITITTPYQELATIHKDSILGLYLKDSETMIVDEKIIFHL